MWKLEKINEDAALFLISSKNSYSIGRKNCDITLDGDLSISKKHCNIYVAEKDKCPFFTDTSTGVWIVDEESKYGTYVRGDGEWEKLNAGQEKKLNHGSIIKFGLIQSIWRLKYVPVIACTSGFQTEGKKKIAIALKSIDGEFRNAWSNDCNLIIVNEFTLTIKVVLALINDVPIVTLDYLKQFIECVKTQTLLPDTKDFRPIIKETLLNASKISWNADKARKSLFAGKKFVFPTKKQLDTLKEVILAAGGKAGLLSYSGNWNKLGNENIVVIQQPVNKSNIPEELIYKFRELTEFLKNSFGKRIVPESEIAQSIAYSSTEKYCNTMSESSAVTSHNNSDFGIVLVEETPDLVKKPNVGPCVVPCTLIEESQDKTTVYETKNQGRKRRNLSPDKCQPLAKIQRNGKELILNSEKSAEDRSKLDAVECDRIQSADSSAIKESKLAQNKANQPNTKEKSLTKNSCITNYFKKQSKQMCKESMINAEKPIEYCLSPENNPNKRKLSKDVPSNDEKSDTKRLKFPAESFEKNSGTDSKNPDFPSNSSEKTAKNLDKVKPDRVEKAFNYDCVTNDEFFEKDRAVFFTQSEIRQLDNTLYSLSLISSVYLKEDGSLIDPPDVLVNVKKFKKQKICCEIDFLQTDENVFDREWFEVHHVKSENLTKSQNECW